jgi:hypothetical protein
MKATPDETTERMSEREREGERYEKYTNSEEPCHLRSVVHGLL